MKLLADENIPIVLVHRLRENGHEIISVTESYQGYTDKKLLKIAQKKKMLYINL